MRSVACESPFCRGTDTGCGPPSRPRPVAPTRVSAPNGPVVVYVVDALRPDRMSVYGAGRPTTPAAVRLARRRSPTRTPTPFPPGPVRPWPRCSPPSCRRRRRRSAAGAGSTSPSGTFRRRSGARAGPPRRSSPTATSSTTAWVSGGGRCRPPDRPHRAGGRGAPGHGMARDGPRGGRAGPRVHRGAGVAAVLRLHPRRRSAHAVRADARAPGWFASSADDGTKVPIDYDRSVRQADDEFRRIVGALRRKGFWPGSTVVYTADHGEEFGEHGRTGHGYSAYDEQLRVPAAREIPRRRRRRHAASRPGQPGRPRPDRGRRARPARVFRLDRDEPLATASAPERELYFTEDLDRDRLLRHPARAQEGDRPALPGLPADALLPGPRPRGEGGGRPALRSGGTGKPGALRGPAALARARRGRLPVVAVREGPAGGRCEASIDLSTVREPFLTAEDHCRWSPEVKDGRLVYREDPGSPSERLLVSADDRGRPPGRQVPRGRTPCSIATVRSRLIEGPTSEEHLDRLRALGYLQGP